MKHLGGNICLSIIIYLFFIYLIFNNLQEVSVLIDFIIKVFRCIYLVFQFSHEHGMLGQHAIRQRIYEVVEGVKAVRAIVSIASVICFNVIQQLVVQFVVVGFVNVCLV